MTKIKYTKPAVKETIFEAKFSYENFDMDFCEKIFNELKDIYPIRTNIQHNFLSLNTSAKPEVMQVPMIRASTEDGSEYMQIGPGIIVANRLKYNANTKWSIFSKTIEKLLSIYMDIAAPKNITRVGVRYINAFSFPGENITLSDYFRFGVQLPEILSDLKGLDLSFLSQLRDFPDLEVRTRFATNAPLENSSSFTLDIDCFCIPSPFQCKIDDILQIISHAHEGVSNVFEGVITGLTRKKMECADEE